MSQDVVDGAAENGTLGAGERLPRRADDDDLRPTPLCFVDDRRACAPRTYEPVLHVDPVRVADRDGLVELRVGRSLQPRELGVQGVSSGTSSTFSARMRAPRSDARLHATSRASSDGCPVTMGTSRRRYWSASAGPNAGGAFTVAVRLAPRTAAGTPRRRRCRRRATRARPSASVGFWTRMTRNEIPSRGRRRSRTPASRCPPHGGSGARGRAPRRVLLFHAQPYEREMRNRERQRCAERVEGAHESGVAGQDDQDRRDTGEEDEREHGVLKVGCRRRKTSGSCR